MDSEKEPTDDIALFREALEDIRPLKSTPRVVHEPPRPAPVPRQRERDERAVLLELLDPPDPRDQLETGEELLFLRDGYQQRILKRLRRGQYSVADEIDLHHMNHDTARDVLLNFISDSAERNFRCVRVVHGKGLRSKKGPVLKEMTRRMLQRHPSVVAFASCRPVDGGTGAVSVLLRNRR